MPSRKRTATCPWNLVLLAVTGIVLCSPSHLLSGDSDRTTMRIESKDVRLGKNGVLIGYILDEQGRPVEKAEVKVLHNGRRVAVATTGKRGSYMITGLRGGVHVVHAGRTQGSFRFWTNDSAPPSARKVALTVIHGNVVRGQWGNLYAVDPNTMAVGAVAIAGFVVAIDKQESINDLKSAISRHEAQHNAAFGAALGASIDAAPVSP